MKIHVNHDFQGAATVRVPDGINPTDAVNLRQLEASQIGIDALKSCRLRATVNRSLSGLSDIDGVTPVAGDRILLTEQTDPTENGSWLAGSGVWTRTTDSITPQSFWFIEEGTSAGNQWKVSTTGTIVVGTTALTIHQFGGGVVYTAGFGVTLSGGEFAADIDSNTLEDASGQIAVKTSVFGRKYTTTIGDGTSTTITVTHGLNNRWVTCQVFEEGTGLMVIADIVCATNDELTVTFLTAPSTNQFRVVVVG